MSIGQLPYPEQISFPAVDRTQITPDVADVALLVATRTIDSSGTQLGVFTSDTQPTDTQVDGLIAQATTIVLTPLPDYLQASLYARIEQAVALQAAVLVETSFYREQANTGTIVALQAALKSMLDAIQEDAGGAGVANQVDQPVMRSTMADYDPYYVMPPPPVVGGGWAYGWAQPPPPTGSPSISSVNPTGASVSNQTDLTVSVIGTQLQLVPGLLAYLRDSADNVVVSESPLVDPSGQGTMLAATFAAPPPGVALGPGWFYLQAGGVGYGSPLPWQWVA